MIPQSLSGIGPFSNLGIQEIARQIRSKERTSLEFTELALASAHRWGVELNCFVTLDDEGALDAARRADSELQKGLDRGPLHGIPVGVKDMIATSGLVTTMGSRHFAGDIPRKDAAVVESLRAAGAVIIGKTQTHEFAYGPTSDRSATGPARNPQDLSRMTGGSSGGSAAAVAAGLLPLALGTDTGGSVRIPAALCGAVGLRPSTDSINMSGAFPLSPTMDIVGPIAGSVTDTALGWWALNNPQGFTPRHWSQLTAPWLPSHEQMGSLRIGRPECSITKRVAPTMQASADVSIEAFQASGAQLLNVPLPEIDETAISYYDIQSAEAYEIHEERIRTSSELFDSEVLERLQAAGEVPGWRYVRAMDRRQCLIHDVLDRLSTVDVLVLPTVPVQAPEVDQRVLDTSFGFSGPRDALLAFTSPWSLLGFPAISLPVPTLAGALIGSVQIVAKPGQERLLLDAALLLENKLATQPVS